ncbi:MAG: Transporter, CPA2 family [Candidatus Woesebacteria bacterium GW2011_GWA1_45_8]|uniref:Transporter, CPA2 family n=1 Tax=Candidatus Woesebacteria bacterium GW2011_GWA1_45_8 TaxID=1618559 RepID=A0A0G1MV74_9BACT|nr:MAG: Transporter, CPA2 family [Candidatus Woesebacteria bacterium GW2011_GWA1_45_8]
MGFAELALLLVVAAAFGLLAKQLRQPLLIGYLLAGVALSATGAIKDPVAIESLGKIGVALLLFLVGLEMNFRELPQIGKVSIFTGLGQIIITAVVGYAIALLLGFSTLSSLYIAVALTFSSTIIAVKLLSEKNDLGSLYGKIAIGILLVQDLVAILILMFLAGAGRGEFDASGLWILVAKAALAFASVLVLSKKVFPWAFEKFVTGSSELLFVVSIAWALGISALVGGPLGFSFEIGGFLAGLSLSNLPEHLGIASKTRPLRDFFLTIFFLTLGSQLLVGDFKVIIVPALIFSVFVLAVRPLIVLPIMGVLRYKKRTSFLTSVTLSQISEFSIIIMAMGATLGHVSRSETAMIVAVGVVTMTASTYLISGADRLYLLLRNFLTIFERKDTYEGALLEDRHISDHIVLVGCDRTGSSLISFFEKKSLAFLVVDFNPKVYARLSADRKPVIFGDVSDPEILDLCKMDKARFVISTVSTQSENLTILEHIKGLRRKPISIFTSETRSEALKLYEAGASYVLVPAILAGEYLRHIFVSHGMGEERIRKMGKGHFNRLVYR